MRTFQIGPNGFPSSRVLVIRWEPSGDTSNISPGPPGTGTGICANSPPAIGTCSMELSVNSFAYSLLASTPASHFLRPSWVIWIYLEMRGGGSGRCRYQMVAMRHTARTDSGKQPPSPKTPGRPARGLSAEIRPLLPPPPSGKPAGAGPPCMSSETSTLHTNRYPTVATVSM